MTIDYNSKLLDKFEIGKVLLHRCIRELLRRGPGGQELGVTIIVHAAEPDADNMHKAVVSTLRDRAQFRGMLADCLCEATMADGIAMKDLDRVANEDLAAIYGRVYEPPTHDREDE